MEKLGCSKVKVERSDTPVERPQLKLLVSGSRSIKSKDLVFRKLDSLKIQPTLLIEGGAPGVDILAGQWARSKGIPVAVYRPNFTTFPINRYRWTAYTMRDKEMVDAADQVVCIWDGHSSGTRITRDYAVEKGKLLQTFIVSPSSSSI